ncbi:type 1 glutamine amidotransferase domain-containing protein [Shewanella zhangzhouensis]|uniref:type 1 glutamine amidotransferase domain-containing protein n=1 Tax=Shewanella zhangzhouensis TaxID=2864213 RepID=UPI001C65B6E3|nr:type 1 glutamine amidotransferase domain-containing protein [Shewanella zhangzhouensis]QYK07024.1 type 1 glutamine amidotransferase domain-containing protein [Shewanella zhangzhouensis]
MTFISNILKTITLFLVFTTAANATDGYPSKGEILLVAASPAKATNGWPIGAWIAEISHPYEELTHAGYSVDIVSIDGGKIELDAYSDPRHESGYSAHDIVSLGFLTNSTTSAMLNQTKSISDVSGNDYDAIIVSGGQAPMYTFRDNKTLQNLIINFYQKGKPTAALCHGVSALVDIKLPNGKYLVSNKEITGFSLAEDKFVEQAVNTKLFDWYLEEALKSRGANYVQNGLWADFAVADGNLITGQQQNSGRSVARLVIKQLEK